MAAPKNCRKCPVDELCDGYDRCVWPVYAAGIKEARRTVRRKPPNQQLKAKIAALNVELELFLAGDPRFTWVYFSDKLRQLSAV